MSSAAVALRNVMLAIAALQPASPFRTPVVRPRGPRSRRTSAPRLASITPDLEASHG